MARNNTTPIGDGSVGLDSNIQSAAGKSIQEYISENNLKANLAANGSMKNVFGATVRMVQRWTPGDKMRILQEYGRAEDAKNGDLDSAVATVLIAHLPKEELKKIIGTEEHNEQKLIKDVYANNTRGLVNRKKQLSSNNVSNQFSGSSTGSGSYLKSSTNDKQLLKGIKKGGNIDVNPKDHKEFKRIRKELEEILDGLTNRELTQIAVNLEINFDDMGDTTSSKYMKDKICSMVNMYIVLLLEKDQKGVSTSLFNPGVIKQVEDLLLLTSAGWITGKVGINDLALREKRKAALAAQKALKSNSAANEIKNKAKTKNEKNISYNKNGLLKRNKDGTVKLFGKVGKRDKERLNANAEKIKNKIIDKLGGGDLDKVDMDQLKSLATSQGVENIDSKTKSDLIDELALLAARESEGISEKSKDILDKAKKEAAKYVKTNPERAKQIMQDARKEINNARASSFLGAMAKGEEGTQEYSDKIPVVSFNQSGDITSTGLLKAVPVFLAGSTYSGLSFGNVGISLSKDENGNYSGGLTGSALLSKGNAGPGKIQTSIEASALKDKDDKAIKTAVSADYEGAGGLDENNLDYEKGRLGNIIKQKAKAAGAGVSNVLTLGIAGAIRSHKQEKIAAVDDMYATGATSFIAGDSLTNKPNPEMVTVKGDGTYSVRPLSSGTQNNNSPLALDHHALGILKGGSGKRNETIVDLKSLKKYISTNSRKIFTSGIVNKRDKVQPVYVANSGFTFLDGKFEQSMKDQTGAVQQVASGIEQLPTMMMGLQQGGLSFNAEAAAAGIAKVLDIANTAATAASQFATGGSMKGGNKVSQIITGDHPSGKNNTELVSVDWGNKNINVKPIPMMASGGDVKSNAVSNITNVKRMTSSERSKPMLVSLNDGIVKYTKELSDVTDDGSSTAVKVYSVNSGINEKIKVGDSEISLFDAVYGMYTSMAALVGQVNTSNQLLASISSTSIAASKSISKLASANSGNSGSFSFTSDLDEVLSGR